MTPSSQTYTGFHLDTASYAVIHMALKKGLELAKQVGTDRDIAECQQAIEILDMTDLRVAVEMEKT